MVRVRFAPSPTGYLHVGNARTALFNYLFARKHNGKFILRIEDTDKERSRPEYETALMEDLRWLGTDWDEGPDIGGPCGPYRQTGRLQMYREFTEKLLREGKAYRCYCTKEELDARNVRALEERKSVGYDNRCRQLSRQAADTYERAGRKPVIRFLVPEKPVKVNDLIRGEVTFESGSLPDFIIVKSDGMPTFHFAVVVDDFTMQITLVIRGEDHLSNTPKHILLFEAIGATVPQFAHMSMTLGPDKTRLSKRHGATSVRAFRESGYLPEAFFNYLALLGWATADSQEIFSKEELIKEFSLERCNKSAAIFDHNKLLWMNGLYIRKAPVSRLVQLSLPFLQAKGLISENPTSEVRTCLEKALGLEQEKLKTLQDVPDRLNFFLTEPVYEKQAVEKFLGQPGKEVLTKLLTELESVAIFTKENLEESVRKFCAETNCKTGAVFHPLRVALSGKTIGPGLFELMELLGKEKVIARIKTAIVKTD